MTESLFRILEIISILLPLTGIFIQVSFRLDAETERVDEPDHIDHFRVTLTSAGMALGLAGVLTTAVLSMSVSGWGARIAIVFLYFAFLLFTAALAVLWLWAHPSVSLSAEQQTLSESTDNDADTE
jgi:hypothetical protein